MRSGMPLSVNEDGTVNFFPEGGDMFEVKCVKCNSNNWKYWIIYGPKSEYVCRECKHKIKKMPDYTYDYLTHKIWSGKGK